MADAASKRRRRRPWGRTVLVGLLLAWLIGRGLGWLGDGGDGAPPREGVAAAAPAPASVPPAEPSGPAAAVPRAEMPTGSAASSLAATPLAELARVVPVEPVPAGPAIDADRFASMCSLVRHAIAQRRFGSALASLLHLRGLPLDALQQAAAVPLADELQVALAEVCGELAQRLWTGQVLAAHRELAALLADEGPLLAECVQQALAMAGVEIGIGRDRRRGDFTVPIPRALPRGRSVRWECDGTVVVGRVVDSRSDQVTIRLQGTRGITFPTLPMVQCEPIAAAAGEAVEMAFAALQRDEVLLARLWWAVARRGGVAEEPRARQLASLLP